MNVYRSRKNGELDGSDMVAFFVRVYEVTMKAFQSSEDAKSLVENLTLLGFNAQR